VLALFGASVCACAKGPLYGRLAHGTSRPAPGLGRRQTLPRPRGRAHAEDFGEVGLRVMHRVQQAGRSGQQGRLSAQESKGFFDRFKSSPKNERALMMRMRSPTPFFVDG
jgi:hypothetical protein